MIVSKPVASQTEPTPSKNKQDVHQPHGDQKAVPQRKSDELVRVIPKQDPNIDVSINYSIAAVEWIVGIGFLYSTVDPDEILIHLLI